MSVSVIIVMMLPLATSQAALIGSIKAIAVNPSKIIGPEQALRDYQPCQPRPQQ